MTTLHATLRRIHDDLTELRAPFALVGGLAVSALTEPRFTRDADLAVAVTGDAEAERLINALQRRRYTVDTVLEHQATGRLATVRLTQTGSEAGPVVDLLFASSGIELELVDLRALIRCATPNDIEAAERALELITGRGHHRGKKLVEDLRVLLGPTGR